MGQMTAPSNYAPYSQTDLVVGSGPAVAANATVTVDYTGWLYSPGQPDGKGLQFDTSIGRSPFVFAQGTGSVIAGWDKGILGMQVGGVRRLVIPPSLAYGGSRNDIIPENTTLIFELTLESVINQ